MARITVPANIKLLDTSKNKLGAIRQVSKLNLFEGSSENFDPDGLYSVQTFGRVGESERMTTFGYIDVRVNIIHPGVFDVLCRLKSLYRGIMSGKEYAMWDSKLKDFVRSNEVEGSTGYSFFMSHVYDIKFKSSKSANREMLLKFIHKSLPEMMTRYVMVMPAGLRDLQVDQATGRKTEDEINSLYRKLISIAQTADATDAGINSKFNDNARWAAQSTFNEIYNTIFVMLEGKKGFIQAKWASRRIYNSTRNVITSMDVGSGKLGGETCIKPYHTVIGLYQMMKGGLPKAQRAVRETWLEGLTINAESGWLFDTKSLEPRQVTFSNDTLNKWGPQEAIEKLIDGFGNIKLRHKPVQIEGHYLALMYEDDDTFKIIKHDSQIPEHIKSNPDFKARLRPISWAEFYYYCFSPIAPTLGGTVTRYPITGPDSIYATKWYLKTTTPGCVKCELDENWEKTDASVTFYEWPIMHGEFLDSMQPYPTRHQGLGADHDGDTMSGLINVLDDANAEIDAHINSIESILNPTGGAKASIGIDVLGWVMGAATAD